MDLVDFLRQRLDEDEQVARFVEDGPGEVLRRGLDPLRVYERDEARFAYLTVDPARVLAEVEAKRRIVAEHPLVPAAAQAPGEPTYGCETCHDHSEYGVVGFGECDTLKLLALPYADHSDYRAEWRP